MVNCAKCKSSTPPIHPLRNDTLYYCNDCLIAATRKRVRVALVSALSPRSLDLSCKLAVAVSSQRMDLSSGWCAWHMLSKHIMYQKQSKLNVQAVHVRFDGDDDATDVAAVCAQEAERVITLDGAVLASVADPTGREDLRQILVRHALAQELERGDFDCIVRGDTADALAASAVSRAAKGQGHLLGDVGRPKRGFAYVMRDLGKDWVAACHRSFGATSDPATVSASSTVDAETIDDGAGARDGDIDDKNIHDLARSFTTHLLQSNPGGVSNILGTVAKLEESDADRKSCALCQEVLMDDEEGNRGGICDACTTGVFGEWRDEVRGQQTLFLLPPEIRQRLMVENEL